MTKFKIEYRKFGIRRSISGNIPTKYAEMTAAQFMATVRISKGMITDEEFFVEFLGVPRHVLARLDGYQLFKITEILEILKSNQSFDDFFIPSIGKYKAPYAQLSGMSFQQFMTVDTFYSWYNYTENKDYLYRFASTLYLKNGEAARFASSDNNIDIDKRIAFFMTVDEDRLQAIVLNWLLIHEWLSECYRDLFPKSETPRKDKNGNIIKSKPGDWLQVFDSLIGDKLEAMEDYRKLECMDIFRIINRRIKDSKTKKK